LSPAKTLWDNNSTRSKNVVVAKLTSSARRKPSRPPPRARPRSKAVLADDQETAARPAAVFLFFSHRQDASIATMTPAFKEWHAIVGALAAGHQTLILRKGGIAEGRGGFRPRGEPFWLLPTAFHEQAEKLRPEAEPWLLPAPDAASVKDTVALTS